jgi:hypothetical protein
MFAMELIHAWEGGPALARLIVTNTFALCGRARTATPMPCRTISPLLAALRVSLPNGIIPSHETYKE